jgi:hypothetical protein
LLEHAYASGLPALVLFSLVHSTRLTDNCLPALPANCARALLPLLPLLQELLTCRTWDASLHPQWLVFEVEGRLQIRPNQYALARTLLAGGPDGRGPIAQLNMGEGKTRVILPMLILELANGDNLVRRYSDVFCSSC